jgi:hypothetical protein
VAHKQIDCTEARLEAKALEVRINEEKAEVNNNRDLKR